MSKRLLAVSLGGIGLWSEPPTFSPGVTAGVCAGYRFCLCPPLRLRVVLFYLSRPGPTFTGVFSSPDSQTGPDCSSRCAAAFVSISTIVPWFFCTVAAGTFWATGLFGRKWEIYFPGPFPGFRSVGKLALVSYRGLEVVLISSDFIYWQTKTEKACISTKCLAISANVCRYLFIDLFLTLCCH